MEEAGLYNLNLVKGFPFVQVFSYDNGTDAFDLSGYEAKLEVRKTKTATAALLTLTSPSGGIVVDGPGNKITVTRTEAQVRALDFTSGYYGLSLVGPGTTDDIPLLEGRFTVSQGLPQ